MSDKTPSEPASSSAVTLFRDVCSVLGLRRGFLLTLIVLGALANAAQLLSIALLMPLIQGLLGESLGRLSQILDNDALSSGERPWPLLVGLAIAILGAAAARGGLRYATDMMVARQAVRSESLLAKRSMTAVLAYPLRHFEQGQINEHVVNVDRLPHRIVRFLPFFESTARSLTALGIFFLAMALLSWPVALGAVAILAIYYGGFARLVGRLGNAAERVEDAREKASAHALDILRNLVLVTLSTKSQRESERFAGSVQAHGDLHVAERRLGALIEPLRELFNTVVLLAFVAGSSVFILRSGPVEITRYLVTFLLLRRAMSSFSVVLKIPDEWQKVTYRHRRLLEVLEGSNEPLVSGSSSFAGLSKGLVVRNLSFAYEPDRPILENVSFDVPAGQRTFIVGTSGSGKTTLVRLILRLYDGPPGTLLADGEDLRDLEIESYQSSIAFAAFEPMLFDDTVRANVCYGLEGSAISDSDVWTALGQAQADALVESMPEGLDSQVGERGSRLSAGECQRIGLARIFLNPKPLVVLDEATSGLDVRTERAVLEQLDLATAGRTTILVAHRLATIRPDDHVVVLEDGRATESGRCGELLARTGAFRRLWQVREQMTATDQ